MDSGFSGDQIIGTYQLIIQTSADQEEFSFWDTRKNSPTNGFSVGQSEKFLTTNLTGKVNFSSDLKGYYDILSEASKISLEAQGGPFTKEEAEEFIKKPFMKEAVELRRFDDQAKILDKKTPNLEHFKNYLEESLKN